MTVFFLLILILIRNSYTDSVNGSDLEVDNNSSDDQWEEEEEIVSNADNDEKMEED